MGGSVLGDRGVRRARVAQSGRRGSGRRDPRMADHDHPVPRASGWCPRDPRRSPSPGVRSVRSTGPRRRLPAPHRCRIAAHSAVARHDRAAHARRRVLRRRHPVLAAHRTPEPPVSWPPGSSSRLRRCWSRRSRSGRSDSRGEEEWLRDRPRERRATPTIGRVHDRYGQTKARPGKCLSGPSHHPTGSPSHGTTRFPRAGARAPAEVTLP